MFYKVKAGKSLTPEQVEKLKNICLPVAEYIKNNCDPMTSAVISGYDFEIVRSECGDVFIEPEQPEDASNAD